MRAFIHPKYRISATRFLIFLYATLLHINPSFAFNYIAGISNGSEYLPCLEGKAVGLVANATSMNEEGLHIIDHLERQGICIERIFAPEHGVRGNFDAGEKFGNLIDPISMIPVVSLYQSHKKPTAADLAGVEVMVFDLQDVGVSCFTYLSTLHYVMEACAEHQIPLLVLDRPNPNGHYIDGPVVKHQNPKFLNLHPVPMVYGMTIGEYALMINGEKWLKGNIQCDLTIARIPSYNRNNPVHLPVPPSPNLPNMRAIYLYPSLLFFEGTVVSEGRGTPKQFQIYGHPSSTIGNIEFIPEPMPGARYPKLKGKNCKGFDLSLLDEQQLYSKSQIDLDYMIEFYKAFPNKEKFFLKNRFIDMLSGSSHLRKSIQAGKTAHEIRKTWLADQDAFKQVRAKYLLYADFNSKS